MNLTMQIGFKLYSDSINVTITGFTYLGINNRGESNIDLMRGDPDEPATAVYIIDTGQAFSWPLQGSQYDRIELASNGNDYSIITDGVITPL